MDETVPNQQETVNPVGVELTIEADETCKTGLEEQMESVLHNINSRHPGQTEFMQVISSIPDTLP